MRKITLDDCGQGIGPRECGWRYAKKVLMVIKAPSGATLSLVDDNPIIYYAIQSDAHTKAIKEFMERESIRSGICSRIPKK